ncbi:hypothetical protein BDF22DRAFT_744908 [Syncephalis plumigaleata]|nr:hypothetical protein BDF22DRAFT_744908 [Syncephalis plumigaleata]
MIVALFNFLSTSWGQIVLFLVAPSIVRFIFRQLKGSSNNAATTTTSGTSTVTPSGGGVATLLPQRTTRRARFPPPNIFYEADLPRNVANYQLRNVIRTMLRNHYGTDKGDIEALTEAALELEDRTALRLVGLWERLRTDENRGRYCTFGEQVFTECGEHCRSSSDYVAYLAPSIAWEYLVVAVIIGLATSSLVATRPPHDNGLTGSSSSSNNTNVDNSISNSGVNDALLLVASKEQRRRQARARFYASWILFVGVILEWILFAMADLDQNDPLGVWPMPFLHDDLSATRHWLLLLLLGATWWDARPRPLAIKAVDPRQINDPDALVTLMTGELEATFHRMQATQLVRMATAEDDVLRAHYNSYHQKNATDKTAVEVDTEYLSGMDRLRARIEVDRIINEASHVANAVISAGCHLSDEQEKSPITSNLHED